MRKGEGFQDVVRSDGVGAPQVRNLTYMVTRREKMKRSLWKVQEQIFQQQVRLLDQQIISGQSYAAAQFQVQVQVSCL